MKDKYYKGTQTFINPYNFVPVSWTKKEIFSDEGSNGTYVTGVLHCSLYTKTYIAIPDTDKKTKDKNQHDTYPFMKNPAEQYMIPGSSIRGAIRSVYETVTNSCFVTSKVDQRITRRTLVDEAGNVKPALLVWNKKDKKWELYEAERHLLIINEQKYNIPEKWANNDKYIKWKQKDLNSHSYGDMLPFDSVKEDSTKDNRYRRWIVSKIGKGPKKGYLYKGEIPDATEEEAQTNKHCEGIFTEKGRIQVEEHELKEMVNDLNNTLEEYRKPAVNKCLNKQKDDFYEGLRTAIRNPEEGGSEEKKYIPIWCICDEHKKPKYLSPACIGRFTYHKTMGDLLQKRVPCEKKGEICKACALFGTEKDEVACSSRIRVTDAVIKKENPNLLIEKVTLKELSSPKISYLPFYINKRSGSWTYDSTENTLKGRKYYWHFSKELNKSNGKTIDKTIRNSTMELIKCDENSTFEFDIYFDKITENQLEELKWVITLGNNDKADKYCYKIGHGKPLGLGSVKLVIDSMKTRCFSVAGSEYKLEKKEGPEIVIQKPASLKQTNSVDDLLKIMDFDYLSDQSVVSYPYIENAKEGDNKTAAHQWFSNNRHTKSDAQKWKSISKAGKEPFYAYACVTDKRKASGNNNNRLRGGETYKGKVTGVNKNGNKIFIDIGITKTSIFYKDIKSKYIAYGKLGKKYPKGTEIRIKYLGEEDGSPKWEI